MMSRMGRACEGLGNASACEGLGNASAAGARAHTQTCIARTHTQKRAHRKSGSMSTLISNVKYLSSGFNITYYIYHIYVYKAVS